MQPEQDRRDRATAAFERPGAMPTEHQVAIRVLQRSKTATFVTTGDGHVLHANRQATLLLGRRETLRMKGGRLTVNESQANERLATLVRTVSDPVTGNDDRRYKTLSLARGGGLPLTIFAAPFVVRGAAEESLPAAILFIRDPAYPALTGEPLQELFGLTPAESKIASELSNGKTADEITTSLGISPNTTRTHLKKIYAKTGTKQQSQLVALLLRSVAVMAPP